MSEFECNYFWRPAEWNIHTDKAWLPGAANHTHPRATMDSANSFAILNVVQMTVACLSSFPALRSRSENTQYWEVQIKRYITLSNTLFHHSI